MPNEIANVYSISRDRNRSKSMAFLIVAIVIGVILVIVFNSEHIPFGRSLNRHPPQLIGLVIIIVATFGLFGFCIRCLVMSPGQTPRAPASNTTYVFGTFNQQPNSANWGMGHPNHPVPPTVSGVLTHPTVLNTQFHPYNQPAPTVLAGQRHAQQQQQVIPQTPPPEFELPPSYAEATKGLHVIKQ